MAENANMEPNERNKSNMTFFEKWKSTISISRVSRCLRGSWRNNHIEMTFTAMRIQVTMMILCIPISGKSNADTAGQMRNAIPKAAPIKPIFFIRSDGLDISAIYACITQNPAPPSPHINLAKRNRRNKGVSHWNASARCASHIVSVSDTPKDGAAIPVSDQTLTSMII